MNLEFDMPTNYIWPVSHFKQNNRQHQPVVLCLVPMIKLIAIELRVQSGQCSSEHCTSHLSVLVVFLSI